MRRYVEPRPPKFNDILAYLRLCDNMTARVIDVAEHFNTDPYTITDILRDSTAKTDVRTFRVHTAVYLRLSVAHHSETSARYRRDREMRAWDEVACRHALRYEDDPRSAQTHRPVRLTEVESRSLTGNSSHALLER